MNIVKNLPLSLMLTLFILMEKIYSWMQFNVLPRTVIRCIQQHLICYSRYRLRKTLDDNKFLAVFDTLSPIVNNHEYSEKFTPFLNVDIVYFNGKNLFMDAV